MSEINCFFKNYKKLYPKDLQIQNNITIYIKLEDFHLIEDFYDTKTLYEIQNKVKIFLESKLSKKIPFIKKLYQLDNGEYVITIDKSLIDNNMNTFISNIKSFQKSVKDKILNINNINYQVSILISMAYKGENCFESSKIGIKKLLQSNKDFTISNNFANIQKQKNKKNLFIMETVKNAIQTSSVLTYFQPIIDNKTHKIVKYESLIRIIDQNNTILTPNNFLHIAKRGKYYYQLTKIVLQKSFKMAIQLNKEVSINLSIRDIESNLIRKIIYDLLKKYKDVANKITFELLEDEKIKDIDTISYFITQVKKKGVKIAIDDFGKGFSNFERLLYYKPDILKIDGLLIKDIDKNSYSNSIVKTIVNFAKEQGISTVAEFVENKKIYQCVKELGVDFSQGYYFGKPALIKEDKT